MTPIPDPVGDREKILRLQALAQQGQLQNFALQNAQAGQQRQQLNQQHGQQIAQIFQQSTAADGSIDLEKAVPKILTIPNLDPQIAKGYTDFLTSQRAAEAQKATTAGVNAKTATETFDLSEKQKAKNDFDAGYADWLAQNNLPKNGLNESKYRGILAQTQKPTLMRPNDTIAPPGSGLDMPYTAPGAPKNIDPLSPEGITATRTKEQELSGIPARPTNVAPRTVVTAQGVMQWNPDTKKFDIKVGDRPPTGNLGNGATEHDPKDIASAIIDGKQPPTLTGLYRDAAPVRAELARQGYDLATAMSDWNATQKNLSSMNSTQQLKLRQAIAFTNETLPQIQDAYAEWKKQAGVAGFKILNKANLATMKQLPGAAGSAATNLDALIADFTSELGTVYKGGNSSTDESLKLAAQNLSGDWNEKTFGDAITRINRSLRIRTNSIQQAPEGVSAGSPYTAGPGAPAKGGGNTSGVTVTDPRGVVHTFPSQAAADAFKKAAGLP